MHSALTVRGKNGLATEPSQKHFKQLIERNMLLSFLFAVKTFLFRNICDERSIRKFELRPKCIPSQNII